MKASICTGLIIIAGAAAVLLADEKEIGLAEVPEAARAAIQRLLGNENATRVTREIGDDGSVIYEVAYILDRRQYEAEVSPDGRLLVVDEQITLPAAPELVAKAIRANIGNGTIGKIERATKGNDIFYEVEFNANGKEHEIKIAPDGQLISKE